LIESMGMVAARYRAKSVGSPLRLSSHAFTAGQ
jgi:hypothetical protein